MDKNITDRLDHDMMTVRHTLDRTDVWDACDKASDRLLDALEVRVQQIKDKDAEIAVLKGHTKALKLLHEMVEVFDNNPDAAELFPMRTVAKAKRLFWKTKDINFDGET